MTENTAGLTRWMIWRPEIARIVNESEENMASRRGSKAIYLYNKQIKSFQDRFGQHVVFLDSMMEEGENPFLENDETLVCVDTRDIAGDIVRDTVNKIESVEKKESQEFFTESLVKKTKCVNGTRTSYPFLAKNHSQNIHLTPQPSK